MVCVKDDSCVSVSAVFEREAVVDIVVVQSVWVLAFDSDAVDVASSDMDNEDDRLTVDVEVKLVSFVADLVAECVALHELDGVMVGSGDLLNVFVGEADRVSVCSADAVELDVRVSDGDDDGVCVAVPPECEAVAVIKLEALCDSVPDDDALFEVDAKFVDVKEALRTLVTELELLASTVDECVGEKVTTVMEDSLLLLCVSVPVSDLVHVVDCDVERLCCSVSVLERVPMLLVLESDMVVDPRVTAAVNECVRLGVFDDERSFDGDRLALRSNVGVPDTLCELVAEMSALMLGAVFVRRVFVTTDERVKLMEASTVGDSRDGDSVADEELDRELVEVRVTDPDDVDVASSVMDLVGPDRVTLLVRDR